MHRTYPDNARFRVSLQCSVEDARTGRTVSKHHTQNEALKARDAVAKRYAAWLAQKSPETPLEAFPLWAVAVRVSPFKDITGWRNVVINKEIVGRVRHTTRLHGFNPEWQYQHGTDPNDGISSHASLNEVRECAEADWLAVRRERSV